MNKKNRFLLVNKKHLLICAMSLLFGGRVAAQSVHENDSVAVKPNKLMTLTHTRSIQPNADKIPKNPTVKFSNAEDALYIELESFTNMSGNELKTIFSPLVVVKPFMRIKDKFTLGLTTTQMIQNYTDEHMKSITHDMYMTAALWTPVGTFDVKYGRFSILNYSAQFAKNIPISNYFINALYMNSGHYFPRAAVATYTSNETAVSVGYAEYTPGFKFVGNGYFVLGVQQKLDEELQLGGMVVTNNKNPTGNIHIIYTPNYKNSILLEFLNIGDRLAMHTTYRRNIKDNVVSLNAFRQTDDGITGGNIGFYHTSSGAYAAAGAIYHDPMHQTNADGTENEYYNKVSPFVELGIIRSIFPRKSR